MQSGSMPLRPGELTIGWITVTPLPAGEFLRLPLLTLSGAQPGPTVGLVAAVHGDEFEGPATIWELLKSLDPGDVKGVLLGVPFANPHAFQENTRLNPLDGVNLNRVFPGRPAGGISDRIAASLMENVVSRCDAVLDLHSGGGIMDLLPMAMSGGSHADAERVDAMMRATGIEIEWRASEYSGTLAQSADSLGIPALTLEVGGMGRLQPDELHTMKQAVLGVLKYFGMVAGTVPLTGGRTKVKGDFLKSKASGFFRASVNLGKEVQRGDSVGRLLSPFGEVVEDIASSTDGLVCAIRTSPPTKPGQQIALVAEILHD